MQIDKKDKKHKLSVLVGKNIALRRKSFGMTQTVLAEKLDITTNAVIRMEKGYISPKMSRLQELADTLECPVTGLFLIENNKLEENARFIAEKLENLSPETQDYILNLLKSAIKFANTK